MGEILQVIRWTFFFPAGMVILFFALARAPLERIGDHAELVRKIFLIVLILFAIRAFPFAMQTLGNVTSNYTPPPASEIDMGKLMEIKEESGAAEFREIVSSYSFEWFGMMFRNVAADYCVFLIWLILFIPSKVGAFVAGILINAAMKIAIVISPLMLPMITLKETKAIGINFLMTSIALGISPVGIVLIDAFLREEFAATMLVLLIPSIGGMVGSGAAMGEVASAVAIQIGMSTAGPQIFILLGILVMLVLGILFLLTALYALSGFILVKIITTGAFIAGVSGGMAGAGSIGKTAAMPIIEGAEAVNRTISMGTVRNQSPGSSSPPQASSSKDGVSVPNQTVRINPPPALN